MRPEREPVLICILRRAVEITGEPVQIHHGNRRLEIIEFHRH
jgi:hypothetical protein